MAPVLFIMLYTDKQKKYPCSTFPAPTPMGNAQGIPFSATIIRNIQKIVNNMLDIFYYIR